MNHDKVAGDAVSMMSEPNATAAMIYKSLHDELERRANYFKEGKIHKYSVKYTLWVECHHKDVLNFHCKQSWYIPGASVRKVSK